MALDLPSLPLALETSRGWARLLPLSSMKNVFGRHVYLVILCGGNSSECNQNGEGAIPKAFCLALQNKRLQFYCLPQVASASRLQCGEIIPGLLVRCVYYLGALCNCFLGVCGGRQGRCRIRDFLTSSEISEMSPVKQTERTSSM